jgi:hypothetical protein
MLARLFLRRRFSLLLPMLVEKNISRIFSVLIGDTAHTDGKPFSSITPRYAALHVFTI